ncbi:copper homeostasis protein CutC [Propionicicella superfundia]|uniref:copper homeostasis protein CutC n=1 Tax=Propionicicella superfundia TaxID=348582 RepID=UPI00040CF522|nr:copper homeostasis protein CutC [Propionicicella superfundia]
MAGRLVIVCQHVADARHAAAGGADGIVLVGSRDEGGLSPAPDLLRDVRRTVDIDVRPLVKLRAGYSTDGGEATRLKGLVADYRAGGADGMVLGFVNGRSEVDTEVLGLLLDGTDWPWTFHRGFDACLETDRAWRTVLTLPRLDGVVTAGSARDVEHGLDELIRLARSDPRIANLVQAGGDLQPEHVPWLARAGVRRFQIGSSARPGRSWKAYVDPGLVRSWRTLIDDEVDA